MNLTHFYSLIILGGEMENNDNDKNIVNIFAAHNHSKGVTDEKGVKFFAGFNYVKLSKDKNGKRFNKNRLLKYAENCHYIVSVMRELDGDIWLYNYDVTNAELPSFLKAFEDNTLNGTIIEIEKYFPEDLA